MSAEQVLDDVMRQAAESQAAAAAPHVAVAERGVVPEDRELSALLKKLEVAEEKFDRVSDVRMKALAVGILMLVAAFVLLAANEEKIFARAPSLPINGVFERVAILWFIAVVVAVVLYFCIFRWVYQRARGALEKARQEYIARPIIGIIMGAVVYLALISGLVLISTSGGSPAETAVSAGGAVTSPNVRMEAFWIIAFLAGFSDKFYLGVIDLLVAYTVSTQQPDANTLVQEKKRIPEAAAPPEPPADKKHLPQPTTA